MVRMGTEKRRDTNSFRRFLFVASKDLFSVQERDRSDNSDGSKDFGDPRKSRNRVIVKRRRCIVLVSIARFDFA